MRGVIEHNVIINTIGYGLQIKHQQERPAIPGLPSDRASTIIRHNIISKARQPERGFQGPQPNLLVGHFPPNGIGVEDTYDIYGNILYQNLVNQPLFQGEGNIAFHDNLLINLHGDGIWIQAHNGMPRRISVFHNTVVAQGLGIAVEEAYAEFEQQVVGNAVFAQLLIEANNHRENVLSSYVSASGRLKAPFRNWARLDLRSQYGRLTEAPIDLIQFQSTQAIGRDFAGNPRDGTVRGAYAGPDVPLHGPYHLPAAL